MCSVFSLILGRELVSRTTLYCQAQVQVLGQVQVQVSGQVQKVQGLRTKDLNQG